MNREQIEAIIDRTATLAAERTLKKLKTSDKIKYSTTNSFKKTEELLRLYPKLPADNPEKKQIDEALKLIWNDKYYGIIPDRYFDNLKLEEIAENFGEDVKYQTISKNRNRLVKILASNLFPEDVLNELLNR